MQGIRMKFVTVSTIINLKGTSYEIVDNFKRLIETEFIDVNKITFISINYDTRKNDIENGPVRIYTTDGIEIRLSLTAGYNGSGPNDLCKAMKLCKFEFDENDILSKQEEVNLKYYKDKRTGYQFTDYEGNYIYAI